MTETRLRRLLNCGQDRKCAVCCVCTVLNLVFYCILFVLFVYCVFIYCTIVYLTEKKKKDLTDL